MCNLLCNSLRFPFVALLFIGVLWLAHTGEVRAEDEVVFLNGSTIKGKITEIRKDEKEFDIEMKVGSRTLNRTYQFAKVHAVVLNGKRHVLTPMPVDATQSNETRSRKEIEEIIETVGSTPPDWYDSVKLDYPKTLDLTWPLKPPKEGWRNQENVGQYIWDIINPNTGRWQSGIKLVHHIMSTHQNNPSLLKRDMQTLSSMYFNLFQDYPRAAFWIIKAGYDPGSRQSVMLAECYWRLGNEQMASSLLSSRSTHLTAIKLLGDMKDTDKALKLASGAINSSSVSGQTRGEANLLAGDACRVAGRYDDAIKYYQQAINEKDFRNKEYGDRNKSRAQDSIDAIRLFDKANIDSVADGTYSDQAVGYNGPVVVEVVVANKKIESVKVTRHQEKQFYAAITDTTGQIKEKQGVTDIDATSGATITSQAIVNGAARALAKGSN